MSPKTSDGLFQGHANGRMSIEGLDVLKVRVEVARMSGDMPQYVEDVDLLLRVVDRMEAVIDRYTACVDRANVKVGILKAQALTGSDESPKHDRELLVAGALQIVDVFNGGTE